MFVIVPLRLAILPDCPAYPSEIPTGPHRWLPVQRLADVAKVRGVFDGINIKLMKCTGLREAHQMIVLARALGLKVMLGCMTETSCAISAAAQLSPLVDWADLDGAVLIANDCFDGATIVEGKMLLPDSPGIGVVRR